MTDLMWLLVVASSLITLVLAVAIADTNKKLAARIALLTPVASIIAPFVLLWALYKIVKAARLRELVPATPKFSPPKRWFDDEPGQLSLSDSQGGELSDPGDKLTE